MILGISGPIGAGKSFLAERLQKYLSIKYSITIIKIDDIRRQLLWSHPIQITSVLRKQLALTFKLNLTSSYKLNREELTSKIFENSKNFELFKQIITPYIKKELDVLLANIDNAIIEWTYLEEDEYINLLTHPLIHVDESIPIRIQRLRAQDGFTENILERLKYESFLPKTLVVKSDIEMKTLVTALGI